MFVTIKAKNVLAVVLTAILTVLCCVGLNFEAVADVYNGKSVRKLPVYGVDCGEEKKVALTFDAAWGADKTQSILDTLEENGATGTFFLVGFWVDKYPDMVKAIANSGCEIGNHSKNHLHMSELSKEEIVTELKYVSDKVEELTGSRPAYFRPPFGDYDDLLIDTSNDMGLYPVQWDVDSLDWKELSAQDIVSRIVGRVKAGSIILCHNDGRHTAEALPAVLDTLKARGYEFVPVGELIYRDGYTIDPSGRQVKNA